MRIIPLEPHGMCAGVNAAIAKALKLRGVYCLHALVHNEIVINELKALGFTFVERIEDVPEGETVVFSAHGVSPRIREIAKARRLKVVDTTCPFVAKVHKAAKAFAERGLPVVILGDPNHAEAQGIAGEVESVGGVVRWNTVPSRKTVPRAVLGRGEVTADTLVRLGDAAGETHRGTGLGDAAGETHRGTGLAVVSQTTMNADDVVRRVAELRATHPGLETTAEVCRATKERQDAVRAFCRLQPSAVLSQPTANSQQPTTPGRAVLVLGSTTSSNSKRLAEVARQCGAKAFLAGSMDEVKKLDFTGVEKLGVTSGASTPERFFMEAVKFLRHVPEHVAMIMDGNGRWATHRGKKRGEGHIAGAKTLGNVLEWCGDRGIKYLTVYAFSTENWKRPKEEVDGLMSLFARMLKSKEKDFMKNEVRFRMIGRRGDLSAKLLKTIEQLEAKTAHFERQFIVAISYGGRAEIIDAVNAAVKAGEPVTEETFAKYLYAPDVPDPDLVIRTSGELRTSNFLLWETAYAEYYFTDVLWPDFSEAELDKALDAYASRHRRKGGV